MYSLVEQEVRMGSRGLYCIHLWYPVSRKRSMHILPWILREFVDSTSCESPHPPHCLVTYWLSEEYEHYPYHVDVCSVSFCWFQVVWITTSSTLLVNNIDFLRDTYTIIIMLVLCLSHVLSEWCALCILPERLQSMWILFAYVLNKYLDWVYLPDVDRVCLQ